MKITYNIGNIKKTYEGKYRDIKRIMVYDDQKPSQKWRKKYLRTEKNLLDDEIAWLNPARGAIKSASNMKEIPTKSRRRLDDIYGKLGQKKLRIEDKILGMSNYDENTIQLY